MAKHTKYVIWGIFAGFLFLVGVIEPLKFYRKEIEVVFIGLMVVLIPFIFRIRIRRIGRSEPRDLNKSSDDGEVIGKNEVKKLLVIKRRLIATVVGIELFFITMMAHMMELINLDNPYTIIFTLIAFLCPFVFAVICTLTVCPKCGQWFYRYKPKVTGHIGPGSLSVRKMMITVNVSPRCGNCGLSWYGVEK